MDNIKAEIRSFLARSLKDKQIEDNDDIFKLGLVHSLFAVQLIIFIEKKFGVELDGDDLDMNHIKTINEIVKLVNQKKNLVQA